MKYTAKVTAFLVNPEGVHQEDCPVPLDFGEPQSAAFKLLTGIRMSGGFVRVLGPGHIEWIPLLRVRQIEIVVGGIALADNLDIASIRP